MRRVKLIRELVIDEVPVMGCEEIRYFTAPPLRTVGVGPNEFMAVDATVTTHVVPIHRISRGSPSGVTHTYIAYSKEVQDLLEMPFDAITRESENCRALTNKTSRELGAIKNMRFWDRLRFLFVGAKIKGIQP